MSESMNEIAEAVDQGHWETHNEFVEQEVLPFVELVDLLPGLDADEFWDQAREAQKSLTRWFSGTVEDG